MGTRQNYMSNPLDRSEAEPNVDDRPITFGILQIYSAHLLDFPHNLVRFYIVKALQKCFPSK